MFFLFPKSGEENSPLDRPHHPPRFAKRQLSFAYANGRAPPFRTRRILAAYFDISAIADKIGCVPGWAAGAV